MTLRRSLTVLALAAVATAASAEPVARVVSLRPGAAAGEWTAVVAGSDKVLRSAGAFLAYADATRLKLSAAEPSGGTVALRLTGASASTTRIVLASGSPEKPQPLAAVAAGPDTSTDAALDDLTIYHIMVDMFRNGNKGNDGEIKGWKHPNYAGGDLQGVIEGLDHIRALGANAIWLSPIFAARTSHGYDATNYYRIADQVAVPGDEAASLSLFRTLVKTAHDKGIKIILDVPLNHASKSYDLDAGDPDGLRPRSTGPMQPAEKLWESWGGGYRYWNFDHEPTRRFLKNVALHWLRDEGVDGLRLDYVRGAPREFWAELTAEVAKVKPGAFLVGECWADDASADRNAAEIATYYATIPGKGRVLPSLLDFPMQDALVETFARGGPASDLEERLQGDDARYGAGARPFYFLDNHDMTRFASWAVGDADRTVAAVTFLAAMSSPIVLFYGTETGLSSGAPKPGFTDAGRVPMPWGSLDTALVTRVHAALEARRDHPALRRGGRLPLYADKAALVMAKVAPEETAFVAVNVSGAPVTVDVDASGLLKQGATLTSVAGGTAPAAGEGGRLRWTIPAKTTAIATIRN